MGGAENLIWTCSSCLRAQSRRTTRLIITNQPRTSSRAFRTATALYDEQQPKPREQDASKASAGSKDRGALSRRLSEMVEETMDTGSKSDRKTMADAGFSDELKKKLEERILQSSFGVADQQAASQVNIPSSAGQGTRDQAAAAVWTGTESLHDSALRMLDDSHKRLRSPARIPRPVTNLRPAPKHKNVSAADRMAKAREKTSIYAISKQSDLTEAERDKMRQELKERFTPGARPMPTTLQGLTSLANERIEDAIARGQFKNIQRGKGINTQRDYAANSPFLDTTEYFMNKIIQKQEIVPPWIEKQQELVKTVSTFRARLRNDWRRHAARSIASEGGSVDSQVRKARSYALTEEIVNPRLNKTVSMTGIDATGNLTTVTVEERIAHGIAPDEQQDKRPEITIRVTESTPENAPTATTQPPTPTIDASASPQAPPESPISSSRVQPMPYPFRDPAWEKTELGYHTLAIEELNSLTRSYNLMAPKIAQKPYYTLQRELNRCFAEIAPIIPDEILERSRKPKIKVEVVGHKEGGVMEKFSGTGHVAKVRDEDQKKGYGFKEFWRDLFGKDDESRSAERKERSVA